MRKAWIALSLAPAVALVGCKSEPEPVAQVPPPNYAAEPEPLPPVAINEGAKGGPYSGSALSGNPEDYNTGSYNPQPLDPAPPASRTYTVRKGDTLWSIAKRTYGNGQRWVDIAQANQSVDPKKLAIGQQITLP